MTGPIRVGTAGWSISARHAGLFPTCGTHLQRYGTELDTVEINTSFYRPHRWETYERWAGSVPAHVRFSVKLPKAITHEGRLRDAEAGLDRFAGEVSGLGTKLGVVLVQLPPSLLFDPQDAQAVFAGLRARLPAAIACEPRHVSWFSDAAEALLRDAQVARVAADPAPVPGAGEPGGWRGLAYWRLHGSPTIYASDYDAAARAAVVVKLQASAQAGVPTWCIFDNTAAGHALGNALAVARALDPA